MKITSTLCSFASPIARGPDWCFLLFWTARVKSIRGQPTPVRSRFAPVKFAITFGSQFDGSWPAFQAIVPSTKYSGMVWTMATTASASPWLMANSDASAAQAMRIDAATTAAKVEKATT